MMTPVNFFLSGTSIGLGASNSLIGGEEVDFESFLPWWVHGVVSDGSQRMIHQYGHMHDSPLKVAMYIFREDLDIKLEKGRNGQKIRKLSNCQNLARTSV